MLNIPEEIKALYRKNNSSYKTWRKLKMRFYDKDIKFLYPDDEVFPSADLYPVDDAPFYTINGTQVPDDNLVLTQTLSMGESLAVGQCGSALVEITVSDVLMDLTGKWFTLSIEAGGYEMLLGIYKVDRFERQADRSKKKIEAYDRMLNFEVDVAEWYRGLTFPMTLKQFRDSLCAYVGVPQKDTVLPLDGMEITKTIEPSTISGRDLMRMICELNGCFGQIDVTGRFKYVFLGQSGLFPSEKIYPDDNLFPSEMEGETLSHYKSGTTYEDYLASAIDRVQIRQEEGDIGAAYGPEGNTYIIQGNVLAYGKSADELLQIAAVVHDKISGRVYRPCKIVTAGLPWVEPGDGIICYTSDDVIETYCFNRTLKGIQAMQDTYKVEGTKEIKQSFGIGTQIIQLEGKTAVVKKSVEEVSVKLTDLKEFTEAQIKIMADQISMKVSKGEVSSQLSIEPDAITLKTNRLSWESTYSSMTHDGTLTCRNIRAINGTFSGVLKSPYLGGDSSGAHLGDFSVSANGENFLQSNNGFVKINSKGPPAGSPGGDYASLFIGGDGYYGVTINGGRSEINCGDIIAVNCRLAHGSTRLWGLGETIDWMWEKMQELQGRIDRV